MKDRCDVCHKPLKFGVPGGCFHETGAAHHISCTLTPEMEEELLNGEK